MTYDLPADRPVQTASSKPFLPIFSSARAKFALFSSNWRHPSAPRHKLEGVTWHGHQVFDLWVTDRYRVLFVIATR